MSQCFAAGGARDKEQLSLLLGAEACAANAAQNNRLFFQFQARSFEGATLNKSLESKAQGFRYDVCQRSMPDAHHEKLCQAVLFEFLFNERYQAYGYGHFVHPINVSAKTALRPAKETHIAFLQALRYRYIL